eukprot:1910949-Rhodomonas_salina.3
MVSCGQGSAFDVDRETPNVTSTVPPVRVAVAMRVQSRRHSESESHLLSALLPLLGYESSHQQLHQHHLHHHSVTTISNSLELGSLHGAIKHGRIVPQFQSASPAYH